MTSNTLTEVRNDSRYIDWLDNPSNGHLHMAGCPECREGMDLPWSQFIDAMHAEALNIDAARPESERVATPEEFKEATAARELGATPEQLARIRTILTERNEATRELDRLRSRVSALEAEDIQGDDPRLIQFWVRAAREATVAGYCPEYDRIAQMAGGPSREELREAGHLTHTWQVIMVRRQYVSVEVEAADEREAQELAWDEDLEEAEDVTDSYSNGWSVYDSNRVTA